MSESFPAARADLEWRTNTGTVKADIADVRREFRESTSSMSSDALKLTLAREKLDRALARHGPASMQARTAELAFRQAMDASSLAAQREAGVLNEAAAAKSRFGQAGIIAGRGATSLKTGVTGSTAAFLGATGLVFALQAGARAAIEFDRSMRNVNSIAHLSESDLRDLSDQVLRLSNVTGKGPTDLANGLYDIVSSGFQAADAVKILEASAKAASAGMTDTATSSKAVVAVLNAYHLSAEQARTTSDLLFQEVNLGVNTFEDLAQNMGDVAPQAAALKIPFEQVLAALAQITKSGTPAAEASTQVSRVLTAMIKPSKELRAEFHHMGYESGQAAVEALGFAGVLQRLSDDAGGNQQKIAAWLGEVRGIRGVLNLTGANLASYNDLLDQMGQATEGAGATERAFEEQQKSLGYQIDRTRANLTAAADAAERLANPALTGAAQAAGDATGKATKLAVAAGDVAENLGKIGVTGDRATTVFKTLFLGPVGQAEANLKAIHEGLDALTGSLDDATAAFEANQAAAAAWDQQFGIGALTTSSGLRSPRPGEGNLGGGNIGSPKPKTPAGSGNPDIDYRIALESAASDRERLTLLNQHKAYLTNRIKALEAKKDLAGWQKQQLLKLIQLRNQEQAQIDQILRKSDQDTAAKQAARERSQLAVEKAFERSSPALRRIIRAESRAAGTKGKQDDVDQAQREVDFWKNRLEQLDRTSGAYEHVASKLAAAETKLSRAQGKLDSAHATPTTSTASTQLEAPRDLRLRQLRAALSDNPDEELVVARVLETYWQRKLNQTKKSAKVYEEILQELVSAHDAVKGLEQQLTGSGPYSAGAVENEFLTSMQAILSQIAPNFGSYGGGLSSTQAYELVESNRESAAANREIASHVRSRAGRDEAYGDTIASY